MRRLSPATLAATALLMLAAVAIPAVADPSTPPSAEDVQQAQDAAAAGERDVDAIEADLAAANAALEQAEIAAARAAEAYNGARYHLEQARAEVAEAEAEERRADATLAGHEEAYAEVIASTYGSAPELQSIQAVVAAEDPVDVVDAASSAYQVNSAMGDIERAYASASADAEEATDRAEDARAEAADLEQQAAAARDGAAAAAANAESELARVAGRKQELVAELAELQGISVELAAQRQAALEQRQREEAAAQAPPAPVPDAQPAEQPAAEPEQPAAEPDPAPAPEQPAPEPAPVDPTPPPASGGASAAVSFARAQIGEPYVWAADGPDSWDCSGLTMRAWEAGGKYLPHYSVAQYEQSTPISSSQLRPGDLVFWGDSPGSIYHVAIYSGNGRIIHAPRTGRDVEEVSMYYWIAPDYFARP